MKTIVSILLIFILLSCKTQREFINTIIERDTTIIFNDSLIVIPADSAFIKAYFECDSNNNVIMSELAMMKGRKVTPLIRYKDNWLTVVAEVDSENVYLTWKEIHTKGKDTVIKETIKIEKVYPKWLVILATIGGISIVLIICFIILKVSKIIRPV